MYILKTLCLYKTEVEVVMISDNTVLHSYIFV